MAVPVIDPKKLDKLAEVAIKVGLNLKPGQDLYVTAPTTALPLARLIAEQAYKAGAGLVTTMLSDEDITLARYRYGQDASFDRAAGWLFEGMAKAFSENTARLAVSGDNPMMLAGQDTDKIGRANRAMAKAYKPAQQKIVNFEINWSIVPYPGAAWAKAGVPRRRRGRGGGQARRRDLCGDPHLDPRPDCRLGRAQWPAEGAQGLADRPEFQRPQIHRPWAPI